MKSCTEEMHMNETWRQNSNRNCLVRMHVYKAFYGKNPMLQNCFGTSINQTLYKYSVNSLY